MTPAPPDLADGAGRDARLLEARGLSKSFPGVRALDRVDFNVRRGEIHALMGENGAGKSTLIKLLTGVHARDEGSVRLDGEMIRPASPRQAEALGISTVYQEVNLVPHLSIAENIGLGREPTRLGLIRWREVRRRARAALARLELDLDVARELGGCSIAVQQLVAIARALDMRAKLLILDEPTSSLDADETAELFLVMRRLRDAGLGIVFVTHFLDQVYQVADRITVLRDGRLVGEYEAASLSRLELVGRMVGREFSAERAAPDRAKAGAGGQPLLDAQQLSRRGAVDRVDLSVQRGEVVGLAGLLGSGRTEIARLLFGIDRATHGGIAIEGRPVRIRSPRDAVRHGLAFTPENRKADGIVPHLSVRENIVLALQARQGIWRRISRARQEQLARRFIDVLRIRTPSPSTPVASLSGGNQQKVLLARWLATDPKLLILDEPTRGIDIGARAEIERLIDELRGEGRGVLLISSELEELVRACGRLVVLRDRRKVAELVGADVSENAVMEAIARHGD
ncbi:MAG: Fructose import ATP-binding protein FruK [Phycisphaerae bacterium]|nr:Fructose import ATP-binding protein FruK [Phycisphaerae bacterium]